MCAGEVHKALSSRQMPRNWEGESKHKGKWKPERHQALTHPWLTGNLHTCTGRPEKIQQKAKGGKLENFICAPQNIHNPAAEGERYTASTCLSTTSKQTVARH